MTLFNKNIGFKNEPCSYIYDGIHISSPVTLKIQDFKHAGVTVRRNDISHKPKLRLYSKSVIANELLKTRNINPIIEVKDYKPFTIYTRFHSSPSSDFVSLLSCSSLNALTCLMSSSHVRHSPQVIILV